MYLENPQQRKINLHFYGRNARKKPTEKSKESLEMTSETVYDAVCGEYK